MAPSQLAPLRPWASRFGAAVLAPLLGIPLLALALTLLPGSPWSLPRADQHVVRGRLESALATYDATAHRGWRGRDRAEATWRAATTAAQLDQPEAAARYLRTFLTEWPDHPRAGRAWARLAVLEGNAPAKDRALMWEHAARAAPADPDAGRWVIRAAQAWAGADQVERARVLLRALLESGREDHRFEASLTLATLLFEAGRPTEAYPWFQQALDHADTGARRRVARLALHTCGETLSRNTTAAAED